MLAEQKTESDQSWLVLTVSRLSFLCVHYYCFGDRVWPCNLGRLSAHSSASTGLEFVSLYKTDIAFIQPTECYIPQQVLGQVPLVLTLCYVLNSSAKGCPLLCSAGGDPRLQTFMLQRTPSQGDFTFKRLPCLELTSVAHAHLFSLFLFQ